MEEIWKGVIYQGVDYSWRLEVSNLGQLRNTETKHIYKPSLNRDGGYLKVYISTKGAQKTFKIHRCVAETFIENTYDKNMVVNHKNGIKTDNFVENLEFVTQAENVLHAVRTGLRDSGVKNSSYKLSVSDIEFIIKNYKSRDKEFGGKALATKYSVDKSTISKIINGKIYINEVKSIKKDLMED